MLEMLAVLKLYCWKLYLSSCNENLYSYLSVDLRWLLDTQMCVGVRLMGRIHVSTKLCLRDIAYSFLPMAFRLSDMVTMNKTLELINFSWPWLNFQGHRGAYVSKLTLLTQYFL